MSDPTPIRDGILPETDTEREMADYVIGRVKLHSERLGEPCHTIAIYTESDKGRAVHSFSLNRNSDQLRTCSAAAVMFLKRAVK